MHTMVERWVPDVFDYLSTTVHTSVRRAFSASSTPLSQVTAAAVGIFARTRFLMFSTKAMLHSVVNAVAVAIDEPLTLPLLLSGALLFRAARLFLRFISRSSGFLLFFVGRIRLLFGIGFGCGFRLLRLGFFVTGFSR